MWLAARRAADPRDGAVPRREPMLGRRLNYLTLYTCNFEGLVLGCIEAPAFTSKYALESSRRDLLNALF